MNLTELAPVLQAKHQYGDANFTCVSIDSRTLQPGDLFIALKGSNFDGHDFLADVQQRGAVAAIVEKHVEGGLPQLIVEDTKTALGQLAAWHRNHQRARIAALTGSYGKTTVKEMIASIMRQEGETLATYSNFNNDIGVPLTLLNLTPQHEFAVLELGANYPGEIAYTTQLVKPHIALITAADIAHLAGFGHSVKDIAKAKGEIFQGLNESGVVVLNADDPHFSYWRDGLPKHQDVITFATKSSADFQGQLVAIDAEGKATVLLKTSRGEITVKLSLPGAHQVINATAAAAVTHAMGISLEAIQRGLETVQAVKGRTVIKTGVNHCRLIDDTYNASPAAVKAALQLLTHYGQPRIAILGDMLELGPREADYHSENGVFAKAQGIEKLYGFGELTRHTVEAFGEGALHFSDQNSLIATVKPLLTEQTTVLVKGSRGMRMENIVAGLMEK